jgi:separase
MDFCAQKAYLLFSSSIYLEALDRSRQVDLEERAVSSQQRIHARAKMLEISATAAHVFALIQHTKVG